MIRISISKSILIIAPKYGAMVILLFISIILISSCKYDNKEDLYPELFSDCDTFNISFTSSVFPILNDHCLVCHGNDEAPVSGNNIALEEYSQVKAIAENGLLLGAVKQDPGFTAMPLGGKLDDCSIKVIEKWIDNNFPEN